MSATGKAAQIPDALLTRLATLGGSPALPIAYPDIAFDPEQDSLAGKYIAASYFPNRPGWEGVTSGVIDQGLLLLTVVWPRGGGLIAPYNAAESVKAHFAKNTVLISGTTKVKISAEPYAGQPLIDEHETRIPITIPWVA